MRHVLGTLFSPAAAMRSLAESRPLLPAAAVCCLSGLSWWYGVRWADHWGAGGLIPRVGESCPALRTVARLVLDTNPVAVLVFGPVLLLLVWFLRTAVLHLVAEVLGGTGRALSLLATTGYALSPLLLVAPLCLLLGAAGGWTLDAEWPGAAWRVAVAVLYAWVIVLIVLAVRESHRLTTQRAILTAVVVVTAAVVVHVVLWAGLTLSGLELEDLLAPP